MLMRLTEGMRQLQSQQPHMRCAHMQGVSPDGLLQKIVRAKREMRKGMLSGYMQALDESEGLQDTIARLTARMGVGTCTHSLIKHRPPCCGAHHCSMPHPSLARVPGSVSRSGRIPAFPGTFLGVGVSERLTQVY